MTDKPDFEKIAEERYPYTDKSQYKYNVTDPNPEAYDKEAFGNNCDTIDQQRDSFIAGCTHIYDTLVVPLQAERDAAIKERDELLYQRNQLSGALQKIRQMNPAMQLGLRPFEIREIMHIINTALSKDTALNPSQV